MHSVSWGDGDACPDNDMCIQGSVAHALDVLAYAHILYYACIPIFALGFDSPFSLQSSLPSCIPPHSHGALFASHLHRTLKLSHRMVARLSFVSLSSPLHPQPHCDSLFRGDGSLVVRAPYVRSAVRSLFILCGLSARCDVMAIAHLYYNFLLLVIATVGSQKIYTVALQSV